MSNWHPIETLSRHPYSKSVYVRKPGGAVKAMKAGRERDDAASRARLLAYYAKKELEFRQSAERIRAAMGCTSDAGRLKLSACRAKHLDARADEQKAKADGLRTAAPEYLFKVGLDEREAGDLSRFAHSRADRA
ncbi:hypothetical protein [Enterovirga sp. CN4-39]|uniref:hypothetical protein n=1 Tax=Enterovirga sp. CN4-39 TaxID=3400910 RepID=UPI003C092B94